MLGSLTPKPHFFIKDGSSTEKFTSPASRGHSNLLRRTEITREQHGARLARQIEELYSNFNSACELQRKNRLQRDFGLS